MCIRDSSQAEIDEPPAHRPAVSITVDGAWQGFPSIAAAEQAACLLYTSPGEYFEHEDFLNVLDFNTPQTVAALGTAISQSQCV